MNTNWIAALLFSITPLFAQGEVAPRAGEGATPEWRQRFEEAQQSLQQAREGMQRLMQERAGERRQDPRAGERPMPQRDRAPRQQDERGERQGRGDGPDRGERQGRSEGRRPQGPGARMQRGGERQGRDERQGRGDGRRPQGPGTRMQRSGAPMRGMAPMPWQGRGDAGFGRSARGPMVERLQQMRQLRERAMQWRQRMGDGPRTGPMRRPMPQPQGRGRGRSDV